MQMRAWFRREMEQRQIRLAGLRVVKKSVPMAEGPAPAVLARQAHRHALEQERTEGERLGKSPVVGSAGFVNVALPVDRDPFHFRQDVEIVRHAR